MPQGPPEMELQPRFVMRRENTNSLPLPMGPALRPGSNQNSNSSGDRSPMSPIYNSSACSSEVSSTGSSVRASRSSSTLDSHVPIIVGNAGGPANTSLSTSALSTSRSTSPVCEHDPLPLNAASAASSNAGNAGGRSQEVKPLRLAAIPAANQTITTGPGPVFAGHGLSRLASAPLSDSPCLFPRVSSHLSQRRPIPNAVVTAAPRLALSGQELCWSCNKMPVQVCP